MPILFSGTKYFQYRYRYFSNASSKTFFRYQILPILVPRLFSSTNYFWFQFQNFFCCSNLLRYWFRYHQQNEKFPVPGIPGTGTSHSALDSGHLNPLNRIFTTHVAHNWQWCQRLQLNTFQVRFPKLRTSTNLVFKSVEHLINRNFAFPGKWKMCCRKGGSANNKWESGTEFWQELHRHSL